MKAVYRGPRLMSVATFTECLDKLPLDAVISFAGYAEPYLNPECTRMILMAQDRGHTLLLYTTCVGMDLADVESIRDVPFKIVHLHLPDAEGNAKIHTTAAYLAVVDAMADAFPAAKMMQMGKVHPAMEKYQARIRQTYLHSRAGNVKSNGLGIVQIGQRNAPLRCTQSAKIEDNVLLPDGSLALCCQDWALRHIIGNLLTQSWEEICEGDAKRKVKELMIEGDCLCRTCEFAAPMSH